MKKAIVYGAGLSGIGAKKLLEKKGYEVCLVDDKKAVKTEDIIDELKNYDLFVKSPGIGNNNKLVKRALAEGLNCIDEVELAASYSNARIIAVTGTNGKTTVTTKINELLNYAGFSSKALGNIGYSFAEFVASEEKADYLVLELSSYQLENIVDLKPYISMIINLSPDHLNRYENEAEYYRAKLNIYRNQNRSDYFLLNKDDKELVKYIGETSTKVQIIALSKFEKADISVLDGEIDYFGNRVCDVEKLSLKGIHNLENNLFIIAVAKIIGIEDKLIREFLYSTDSLEHRTELFYTKSNVDFINDSKGTNLDSTLKALEEEKENLILICGGKDKKLDLSLLADKILTRCSKVYLIGETADILEKLLLERGYEDIRKSVHLEEAVKDISENTDFNIKHTVLFSPAASSFDQFTSFEERGRVFKELVKKYLED